MTPKRILIIDDHIDHVAALGELLRLAGHNVRSATNPLFALDLARDFQPQFAFIDIGMPRMDGYQVLDRLKRHFPAARMFAISGRSDAEQIRKSLAAGFEDYFVKPLDIERIERLVADEPGPDR